MTQEDKKLLLKDLCARLPYGVKVWYKYYPTNITEKFVTSIRLADGKIALSSKFNKEGDWYPIDEAGEILIKPYLRPMSSMTEEEQKELEKIIDGILGYKARNYFHSEDDYKWNTLYEAIDWLNKNMFDYRGLIEKGLALEAPEGMYSQNLKNMPYKYFPIEFSSYEDYVKYLKEKGFAIEAPGDMYKID